MLRIEELNNHAAAEIIELLKFKKFSGDLKDWLPVWNQFCGIYKNTELEDEEKLQYLIQTAVINSRAR